MKDGNKIFSHQDRAPRISEASNLNYDLIVIGGGITGAGIILDAALRKMKVLLVEKNDFASGTSSKSTKLIHGGLRYLKQLEFGLVRETGKERAVAHENICHLVHPENMLLPIVEDGTFGLLSATMAIKIYDSLAGVKPEQRKRRLSKKEVLSEEPLIKESRLKSGIVYAEYRTDDARLTTELIKAAVRNDAEAFNYMQVDNIIIEKGKAVGIACTDHTTGSKQNFRSKAIISATGPWVDKVRQLEDPKVESQLHLTKGVHIVLDKKDFPINNAIYFDAFDGRMLFAIPRAEIVYVGTTDTTFKKDLDNPHCDESDALYILNAVNNFFDIKPIEIHQIKSSWSGLRPLIQQKGKGPTELSRKDEIFNSESGVMSIAGGKLTGFRKMAKRIVDLAENKLSFSSNGCQTKNYKIHQNPFKDYSSFKKWIKNSEKKFGHLYDKEDIRDVCYNFGKDSTLIFEESAQNNNNLVLGQLKYCIQKESVFHPLDFFERRTGWLYFKIDHVRKNLNKVVNHMNEVLKWPPNMKQKILEDIHQAIANNSLVKFKAKIDTQ